MLTETIFVAVVVEKKGWTLFNIQSSNDFSGVARRRKVPLEQARDD